MRKRNSDTDPENQEDTPFFSAMRPSTISCETVMVLHPAKSGICMKKNNSMLAYLFPCIVPQWKKRFFVLVGSYLYRFESEVGERPKGSPIPIDACSVACKEDGFFEVHTLRKRYIVKVDTAAEAREWVEAIKERKYQAIKENMGHAPLDPLVKKQNALAARLCDKKLLQERREAEDIMNPVLANPM